MIKYILLALIILVPLYFGVWMPKAPFDLPKAIVLLSLSFAILVIWFVKSVRSYDI